MADQDETAGARQADRCPRPWVFFVAITAGAVSPFASITMPFLLRGEGISVEVIAGISALSMVPFTFMFAWSPLSDMILSRRNWVLVGNFVGASLLFVAIILPRPKYLTLFTVLLVAGDVAMSFAINALGGIMAVLVPDGMRGKSAAWFQAGNWGGGPLLGGAALWLIQRLPLFDAAVGIALMSFLPSLVVLLIEEPPRSLAPSRAIFSAMFGEIAVLLRKRETWLGFLFFLSPLGACAAANLFPAIGTDYHVSPETVLWVTGLPGGWIAVTAGALTGGAISDFFSRRTAYILFGGLVALAAAAMALAPVLPVMFWGGGLTYQFFQGMTLTAGMAFALELGGADPVSAGTRISLFVSAMAAPASYMTWLDGQGYRALGVKGLVGTDACLGLATVVLLVVLLRLLRQPPFGWSRRNNAA